MLSYLKSNIKSFKYLVITSLSYILVFILTNKKGL
jgi:hypothetical protein